MAFGLKLARNLAFGLAAWAGMALTPAQAAVQVTAFTYTPDAVFGGINITSVGFHDGGNAGRFLTTIEDLSTLQSTQQYTYCIDALTGFFTYEAYDVKTVASITNDPLKQEQLAALLSHSDGAIAGAANPGNAAAGIQLAVWAIVYDANDTAYSLDTGNFYTSGDFNIAGGAHDLGTTYLNFVENGTWTGNAASVRALIAQNTNITATQNQAFINTGVPEPATWLSMILGFGILGTALRRGRPAAVATAAI